MVQCDAQRKLVLAEMCTYYMVPKGCRGRKTQVVETAHTLWALSGGQWLTLTATRKINAAAVLRKIAWG